MKLKYLIFNLDGKIQIPNAIALSYMPSFASPEKANTMPTIPDKRPNLREICAQHQRMQNEW